jgi:hypothetical protein
MADGFNPLTLQSVTTIEGLNELNRMLMSLYDNMAGDGVNTRTDTGKLYVRENGSWAVK